MEALWDSDSVLIVCCKTMFSRRLSLFLLWYYAACCVKGKHIFDSQTLILSGCDVYVDDRQLCGMCIPYMVSFKIYFTNTTKLSTLVDRYKKQIWSIDRYTYNIHLIIYKLGVPNKIALYVHENLGHLLPWDLIIGSAQLAFNHLNCSFIQEAFIGHSQLSNFVFSKLMCDNLLLPYISCD